MRTLVVLAGLLTPVALAQTCKPIAPGVADSVLVAPEFHKVLFEDLDVRVLAVTVLPHTSEQPHPNLRPAVFILLANHPALIGGLAPGGKALRAVDRLQPYAFYLPPTPVQAIDNPSDSILRGVRVELKHPGCGPPTAPLGDKDGLRAAPSNHTLVFENGDVRVLSVTVPPHGREPMHTHAWSAIIYFTNSDMIRFTTPSDRSPAPQLRRIGVVRFGPQGLHSVENLGNTPLHLFRVELKHSLSPAQAQPQ